MIQFEPIGKIITPYKERKNIPRQPDMDAEGEFILEIDKNLQEGLEGLEKYDYIIVVFYLDKIEDKDPELIINPTYSTSNKMRGLFATRTPNRPNKIGISTVGLKYIEDNKVYISGIDAVNGTPILDIKPYYRSLDSKDEYYNYNKDEIIIYTDGACYKNPGPGGYAAVILDEDKEIEIMGYEPDTTNNRMELRAVIEALKVVRKNKKIVLYSDSNYVVKGINEWIKNWKKRGWRTSSDKPVKNLDLWKKLDKLFDKKNVKLKKVAGHSGNEYNEKVDSLAKEEIEKNIK
ncbi:MAG TPA: ribonuclease HI [Halanaerobiales bacterium]|nr:ribonuclease HI [Halanaerobiales bacterium]